ncbi:MAG: M20/M25/M40 family metallo-hydrolase [Planctomycetota bacterium]|jgi:endoglucanase
MTAHLDHPAFVVRKLLDDRTVELEFRGGVLDPYFESARIEFATGETRPPRATIAKLNARAKPFKRVVARLSRPAPAIEPGVIARWAFRGRGGRPTVHEGRLYAPACDDLAGAAAALSALDVLRRRTSAPPVGVLLTRAEEVGFLGAIAACKLGTIPAGARLLCLENSRSFPESPIGGGPILRVGDKMSVFSTRLTNRLGLLLAEYQSRRPRFKAQRRLMPGGTCEATAFCAYGHEATCLCLPLGNYHNMVDIDGVKAGRRPARVGPEYISVADYHGLVELLVHLVSAIDVGQVPDIKKGMETRLRNNGAVLGVR